MYVSLSSLESSWVIAAEMLFVGLACSVFLYFAAGWLVRVTGLEALFHRFFGHTTRIGKDPLPKAFGKYIAVFVFLLFLRNAVERAGYTEIEQFLDSVVNYLPHLFLALLIAFFGVQMSRTSYSLVYNAVHFENPRTAVILGQTARVITLFFTFSIVISQINTGSVQIIPEYLVTSILVGCVSAASLAFGLAFGLGGREAAAQIIADYLDKKGNRRLDHEKDLKK